jgi:hypothetical protein
LNKSYFWDHENESTQKIHLTSYGVIVEGVGVAPSGRMIGIAEESASSVRISMSQAGDEVVGKGAGNVKPNDFSPLAPVGGLASHEARGGHLIARHVGKTDAELLQRLKDNPKIAGASPFTDRATAEKGASEVLNDSNNKKLFKLG